MLLKKAYVLFMAMANEIIYQQFILFYILFKIIKLIWYSNIIYINNIIFLK